MIEDKKSKNITSFGFPLGRYADKDDHLHKKKKKKGIALLIAMMTVMIMMSLISDMIISSTVNMKLAVAIRDRVKSEYLVKSGFNLGLLVSTVSWGWGIFQAQPNSPMGQKPLTDDDSSIWNMTNTLPPIGAFLVDLIDQSKDKIGEKPPDDPFNLSSLFSEKIANKMRLFEDRFSIKISDESKKININACYTGRCKQTLNQLIQLFSCPAEKEYLENEKNLSPEQLAYRIKDFISDSNRASPDSGFGDRNDPYQKYDPPYNAKGLPLDSVDELKLIEGWDDQIHKIFSNYITVYPFPKNRSFDPKLNLNTVDVALLGCLIPDALDQACIDNFILKMHKIKKDKAAVVSSSISDFLTNTACFSNADSNGRSIKPAKWFDTKTYVLKIEVNGVTGSQDRNLISVIQRILPNDKKKSRGKKVIKRSYQTLHWKLI